MASWIRRAGIKRLDFKMLRRIAIILTKGIPFNFNLSKATTATAEY
jgi:hypothetical protein